MELLHKLGKHAHWLIRVSLAITFIYHGISKITNPGMMSMFPVFVVVLVGLAEIGGAVLILWGGFGPDWATRLAGAFFLLVMLGAIFMVHLPYGWNSIDMDPNNPDLGMEFQVLIATISIFFITRGNMDQHVDQIS